MLIDEQLYLKHYGVKGMRWGVRRNRRAARLAKVGRGEGNLRDKASALGNVSTVDLVRGKGLKGAAKRKGERVTSRNQRVQAGKASIKDKLAYYGGTRVQDLAPSVKALGR